MCFDNAASIPISQIERTKYQPIYLDGRNFKLTVSLQSLKDGGVVWGINIVVLGSVWPFVRYVQTYAAISRLGYPEPVVL